MAVNSLSVHMDSSSRHQEDTLGVTRLTIMDNGTGMSEETLAQAIEPFFTTKQVGEGSGLGLSMVYGFVQQSGGEIRIRSELGVGTTVENRSTLRGGSNPVSAITAGERIGCTARKRRTYFAGGGRTECSRTYGKNSRRPWLPNSDSSRWRRGARNSGAHVTTSRC